MRDGVAHNPRGASALALAKSSTRLCVMVLCVLIAPTVNSQASSDGSEEGKRDALT